MKTFVETVEKEKDTVVETSDTTESEESRRLREFIAKKWHDDL